MAKGYNTEVCTLENVDDVDTQDDAVDRTVVTAPITAATTCTRRAPTLIRNW